MDFYYGTKREKGISILVNELYYNVYIPDYVYEQTSVVKISNWVKEIKGEFITKNEIIIKKTDIQPSIIYEAFYHFIE